MSGTGHSTDYPPAALVTGAARRIGRAIAKNLADHGWKVAVHYGHSADEAESLVQAIADAGGEAVALQADLAEDGAGNELVARAAAALGPLGVLINNASVFEYDDALSVTRASWDRHLEPNLRAPLVLSQAFAHQLPEPDCGAILNILDQRVWNLSPGFTSYTVAKYGLWGLTRTLALELAPRVRVNAIGPGPALPSSRQSREDFQNQCARTPLRIGTNPREICRTVQFILAAPSMTGQMIALDGGQHLGWSVPDTHEMPIE